MLEKTQTSVPEWALDLSGFTPAEVCLLVACRNSGYPYYKFKNLWDMSQRSIIGKKSLTEDFYYSLSLDKVSQEVGVCGWIDLVRFSERASCG